MRTTCPKTTRRRTLLAFLLFLTLLIGHIQAATAMDRAEADAAKSDAAELIREGHYNSAAEILLPVHESFPNDNRVLFDLVAVLSWAERYREAADLSTDFPRLRPPKYSLSAAALAHRRVGNYAMADILYLDGQARYPGDDDFLIGRIYALADSGRDAEADAEAQKYRDAFGETARLAEALRYRDGKRDDERFNRAWDDAVQAAREGDYDKAVEELRILRREKPDEKGITGDLITVLSWAGRHREAVEVADSIPLADAPEYVRRAAALSLRETGELDRAEALYRELLGGNRDDADLIAGLAATLFLQGRLDEAEELTARRKSGADAGQTTQIESQVVAALRDRAAALGQAGEYDEALSRLRNLKRRHPGFVDIDYDILTILHWAGRHWLAARLADQIDLDAAPAHVRRAAAFSYYGMEQSAKAAALFRRLLEERPDDAELAEALVAALVRDKRFDEAEETLDRRRGTDEPSRLAKSEELLVAALRDEAAESGRRGRYDEALAALGELRERHPGYVGIDYDILTILSWAERYREAASLAETLDLDAAPDYVRRAAALSFKNSGDTARAINLHRELVADHPDDFSLREALAMTLLAAGLPEEAGAAIENIPVSAGTTAAFVAAWRDKAAAAGRSGNYDAALAALEEARRFNPDHSGLLHDKLAILSWADRHDDVIAAAAGIDLDAAPEAVVTIVANAYRKTGRLEEALSVYDKAAARFPANPDLAAGRAMALSDLGEPTRAVGLLDEFSRGHPETGRETIASARLYIQPPEPYVPPPRPEAPFRAEQDAIVELARKGETGRALREMEALRLAHPDDVHLLGDHIVLAQWARENELAIELSKRLDLALVHGYVVEAVMRAMMTTGDHYRAQRFLAETLEAQKNNAELMASMAVLLARAGDIDGALRYLDLAGASRHPGIGNRVAEAKEALGFDLIQSAENLRESERRTAAEHGAPDSRRLRAEALAGVRALRLNKSEMDANPDAIPSPEFRRAEDLAAANILNSWGEETQLPRDNAVRAGHYFRALDEYARLQEESSRAGDLAAWAGAGAGKIRSFYGMGMFREAIAEYEAIRNVGIPVPDGALLDAAGAYLGARRPETAKCLYMELLARAKDPAPPLWEDLYEARKGLFWALLENEELSAALAEAEAHWRENSTPDAEAEGRTVFPDTAWQKTDLYVTKGLARLYAGFMAAAEEELLELAKNVPGNAGALAALAAAQSMRGLPRTSNDTLRLAQIHAPSDIGLTTRMAGNHLATQNWREARDLLEAVMPYHSQAGDVRRLKRDWDTHDLRELRVDAAWSRVVRGVDPNAGEGGVPTIEARLFSEPVFCGWRAFIGAATAGGRFAEGYARQNIYLGGVEYRGPLVTAVLEARADQVRGDFEFGLEFSGAVTPDDHWRFPFSFQRTSRDTPLRARNSGINAHSAAAGATYRWNESRSLNTYFNFLDFTDGNRRFGGGGDFNQRLWTCFNHYVDGRINAYSSFNTKDADRPYFNPEFDWELGGALSYGNILWRRYERSWSHVLTAGAGNYHQRHFGSGLVWAANYSQTLTLGDRFSMTYGVGYGRRIYDGDPERNVNAFLSIVHRF